MPEAVNAGVLRRRSGAVDPAVRLVHDVPGGRSSMFEAEKARCVVHVYREGALASIGHDLELVVRDFSLTIEGAQSVKAECRIESIEVVGSMKNGRVDPKALSAKDIREIRASMMTDVLHAKQHAKATFRSTSIAEIQGGHRVVGFLTLHGSEQRVEFMVERSGGEAVAKLTVHQPSFGIKPFKAMLGALRVKPDVIVEVTVPVA